MCGCGSQVVYFFYIVTSKIGCDGAGSNLINQLSRNKGSISVIDFSNKSLEKGNIAASSGPLPIVRIEGPNGS